MNIDRNCKYEVNLQMTVILRRNALFTSHLREENRYSKRYWNCNWIALEKVKLL